MRARSLPDTSRLDLRLVEVLCLERHRFRNARRDIAEVLVAEIDETEIALLVRQALVEGVDSPRSSIVLTRAGSRGDGRGTMSLLTTPE